MSSRNKNVTFCLSHKEDEIREPFSDEIGLTEEQDNDDNYDNISSTSSSNSEDNWLNDVTEEDIKCASKANKELISKNERAIPIIDKKELIKEILPILLSKETILDALQRLNKKQPPSLKFTPKSRRELQEWNSKNKMTFEEIEKVKKDIILLSSSSTALYSNGFINIYELEKEAIYLSLMNS